MSIPIVISAFLSAFRFLPAVPACWQHRMRARTHTHTHHRDDRLPRLQPRGFDVVSELVTEAVCQCPYQGLADYGEVR